MKRLSLASLLLFAALFLSACGTALTGTATAEPFSVTAPASETVPAETKETGPEPTASLPDPAEDGVLHVLLIGNSFCLNWPDELWGMLNAAGIRASVCNVYYPGCTVDQHWEWYMTKQKNYSFYTHDEKGSSVKKDVGLKFCLDAQNWDIISLQQHFAPFRTVDFDTTWNGCQSYTRRMVEILRTERPLAKLCWHETWAYQAGHADIPTVEAQTAQYEVIRAVSEKLFEDYGFDLYAPAGDAWQLARKDPAVGDVLCKPDLYHDSPDNGGQFLNGCVWFEVLTGQSVIGNTFRPTEYTLTEAKIAALQKAAHEAVAALRS